MFNKVILIGNVGGDPQVRSFENGKVANLSLATSERWYDKDNQVQERTQWHNIVCYKNLAELADKHIRKGVSIMVEGKVIYREWEDDNKQKRYATDIVADTVKLLSKKEDKNNEKDGEKSAKIAYKTPATAQVPQQPPVDITNDIPF